MFVDNLKGIKNGDILRCDNDLFMFDDSNGNPSSMANLYRFNGFWNYIKAKEGSIYDKKQQKFVDKICQGYDGLEYYKNGIYKASKKDINLYKNAVLLDHLNKNLNKNV